MIIPKTVLAKQCIPNDVKHIHDIFFRQNYEIYLVGGCVRDFVLGNTPTDFDFCIDADIDEIISVLSINGIPYDATYIALNYVIANPDGEPIDITSMKGNPRSLEYDLTHRDFTMNAMAYDINKELIIDYSTGIEDLNNKSIRLLDLDYVSTNPKSILRAIRFAFKYSFTLEKDTFDAMMNNIDSIVDVNDSSLIRETGKLLRLTNQVD